MEVTQRKRFFSLLAAGAVSGLIVLGVAGGLLMSLLAFATPEDPRFTVEGTFHILILAAFFGAIIAPLLPIFVRRRLIFGRMNGGFFGLASMLLALITSDLVFGFEERILAPPIFIAGTIVLFSFLCQLWHSDRCCLRSFAGR